MEPHMSIRISRTTILALGFSLVSLAYSPAQTTLKMSTTTSTENSGLLKVLLPPFEKAERANVRVIAVNPAKHPHVNYETARRFIEFVTGDEGQRIISSYRINGHQLFYPNAHK